ncbi:serine-rich adhesin for platelets [Bicyclus anynana]|uniref:Serine-rich adhesin for platelets n=1 Tax=Bicyclus anynana TaxID=110368 RepID=A0A6J1MQL9_BICAN|nr:serine-rich adhesin for platelets [Bicyclus anynana]XP_023935206.2 serine-rich adhesin for platelets [Bicyclus anynana]XP_023935207.2 serine-rich adhesin for platelets [Bicyclus anynana]
MRWRWGDLTIRMPSKTLILLTILSLSSLQPCHGSRRTAQRRKDIAPNLFVPAPSAESLTAIAQAMGAAGFEDYTEGKRTLVKRLIPPHQPEIDIVEHLGVIGKANVDFPALPNIPTTGFNCKDVPTGYYADLETDCQVFHICDTSRKISFLCPNGTIFSQSHLICDWWFKVDCASAPALYESSVEYYSNEQKKAQRISNLSKNPDLLQIGIDSNVRAESKRAPVTVPSTTERLLRHRQKLQSDTIPPNAQATARSYQTLFDISPTQRTAATTFEKRRKNLVQLIANNFGNPPARTTLSVYDSTTPKTTIPAYDHNSLKEMQVAAETASFAQNQNRQYLQEYSSKNYRPYPVYTPNLTSSAPKAKGSPTLTTLYDIQAKNVPQYVEEATTKRQTLVPYTKSYASTINDRREPYTRPGVSLLRDFIEKEKNKSISATTVKLEVTARSDKFESKTNSENKVAAETKDTFESVTKIPQTTRDIKITTFINDEVYAKSNPSTQVTTEQTYQERRDRLLRKLSADITDITEPTTKTTLTEKYYGDQTNRPGLIVPPSLTPKTLHSLAIYYATALDNLSTTPPSDDETTTPAFDANEPIENSLPALFSRHTITKYGKLFGRDADKAELLEEIRLNPNSTYNDLAEDLQVEMSQGPLASSPQIRELAQVFTHALSAYLQDPVQFRKVLSDIRPTHPSFAEMLTGNDESVNTEPTTTVNEEDDEILGFSDEHKVHDHKISENSVRGGKALNIATDYPTTVEDITTTTTTELPSTTYSTTTRRSPFRCCGRISASYTTAPTTRDYYSNVNFNTGAVKVNLLATNQYTSTTENYTPSKNERLQNNKFVSRFGKPVSAFDITPSNDYTDVTTLPTAWGGETFDSTLAPITNSHQMFESKKIKSTTSVTEPTPVYFTETDSIDSVELENEEELQRAHSQSFVSPQSNNLRQGKQLKDDHKIVKKPAKDLEAPNQSDIDTTTTVVQSSTTQPTTTLRDQTEALTTVIPISSSVFTSPDTDKSTNDFQWPTTFGNWHSTILDPITLNDGLSVTGQGQGVSEIAQQTNSWALDTATTPITYSTTTEPSVASTTDIEVTATTSHNQNERFGKLLRESTSTEPAQDLSTVTDTIVEKAKEIMEGMNATTTQKLMNVMKKTKSKSVKRLILLLVQTCDDDHNSTAEASKKALLEALMAVSPKDMDEIAKEEESTETPVTVTIPDVDYVKTTLFQRRMDRIPMQSRRGKSLNVDVEAINSLSNPTTTQPTTITTENIKTEETTEYTTVTTARPTTLASRRGGRKFMPKTTEVEQTSTTVADRPIAEARLPAQAELKPQADTRALELLRSLYTIAARWG